LAGASQGEVDHENQRTQSVKGKIQSVIKGATTAHVRLDIGGAIVTASITNQAVDELQLREGMSAYAVVKASDVIIAIDE
jgi:molybdopterin-binding protein